MGREGHRRGEESDALAAIARALRAGAPSEPEKAAAATPLPPAASKQAAKKDKRDKGDASEKKRKKSKHDAAAAEAPVGLAAILQPPEPATAEGSVELALERLRQAASVLREVAYHDGGPGNPLTLAALQQQLDALAACSEQLCTALAAAGAAQPPAALHLLQTQARLQLNSIQHSSSSMPALPPSASQLTALRLQAEAVAAAVKQGQAQPAAPFADDPGQRLRFQQHFMAAFADCFAAEVEALQEAEPPIPAGVLLQCVRMAADSEPLHPPTLRAVVLDAAAATQP